MPFGMNQETIAKGLYFAWLGAALMVSADAQQNVTNSTTPSPSPASDDTSQESCVSDAVYYTVIALSDVAAAGVGWFTVRKAAPCLYNRIFADKSGQESKPHHGLRRGKHGQSQTTYTEEYRDPGSDSKCCPCFGSSRQSQMPV